MTEPTEPVDGIWRDRTSFRGSNSFPGLNTQYIVHKVDAALGGDQFKPEGYVERQKDKDVYFKWRKV